MAVSGFPIKKSAKGTRTTGQKWLSSLEGAYGKIVNNGSNFNRFEQITGTFPEVGDQITVSGTTVNGIQTVTSVTSIDFVTGTTFTADSVGGFFIPEDLEFEDTPEGLLREVHVQFDTTGTASTVEITFDGTNFMVINNNQTLIGLATFTFFVVKDTKLNFRVGTASALVQMAIVVTSA